MTEKSDKGKKNETGKKNQTETKSEDSSTFSYEVPIPGAAPEPIKKSLGKDFIGNAQTWGQEHIQQSVSQLEQIVIIQRNV